LTNRFYLCYTSKVSKIEALLSAEKISEALISAGIPPELVIVIIAALPIIELRGAIPFGINLLGMPWYTVLPLAILGNMLPVPLILIFIEFVAGWLSRMPVFDKFFNWLFERTRRNSGIIEKYKRIGLALFVAVPIPATGAWTGSLAAVLLSIERKWAGLAILTGVIIAGIIVTILSLLGWTGAIIAGVALCLLLVYGFWRSAR
jgi:uncharacterized membrane protein